MPNVQMKYFLHTSKHLPMQKTMFVEASLLETADLKFKVLPAFYS